MARHWSGFIRTALVFFAAALPARATDSWESIGVSTASLGRGGCDVAVGDSALSQVANPATLSLAPRDSRLVEVSGQIVMPTIRWSTSADSSTSRSINPFGNVGMTFPWNKRLTFGLAFYSKAGAYTDYYMRPVLHPTLPRHVHGDLKDGAVLFDAAYKLTDKLSIGAGLRAEFLTGRFRSIFGPVDVELDRIWALGAGYQLGLHYQATKKLALGAGYFSPSFMTNVANGDLDVTILGQLTTAHFGDANVEHWRIPQKIAAGAAYDLTNWCKLVAEARWVNFQNSFLHKTFIDTYGFPRMHVPFNLEYRDEYVLAAGAEFKLSPRWKLDVGYNYSTNPVDSRDLFPLAPTPIQHHLTMGLRYERKNWWIGGGYIYGFANRQAAPGVSNIVLGNDFAVSTIEHQQHEVFFGVGFHW